MEVSIGSDFSTDCEHGSAASPPQELCLCFPQVYLSVCHLPDIYFHAFEFHILWRKCVGKSVVCFTRVRKSSNGNFFSPKRGAGSRVREGQGVVRRVWPQIFQTRTSDCCEEELFLLLPTFLCLLKPSMEIYGDPEKCLKQENRSYGKKV